MMIETRRRLSRGSVERQVSHWQAIEGTPVDVPVPRKVSFITRKPRTVNRKPEAVAGLLFPVYGSQFPVSGSRSFSANNVTAGVSPRCFRSGRAGEGDVLHPQVGEPTLEDL